MTSIMPEQADGFLRLLSPEQAAEAQARVDAEVAGELAQLSARIPEPQNHDYALALQGVSTLAFGTKVFHVPPVAYPAGVELQQIQQRLKKLEGEDESDDGVKRALLAVLEDAVHCFWTLVRPASLWGRLFWRWRANPFLDCTEQEIGELFGFFSLCRTRSRVRPLPTSRPRTTYHRVISRKRPPSSPVTVPPGSARTGTR